MSSVPLAISEPGSRKRFTAQSDKMLNRAIREGWPIPDRYRAAVMERQAEIAISEESSPRDASRAAAVLIAADKLNLQIEEGPKAENHLHLHDTGPTSEDIKQLTDAFLASMRGNANDISGEPVLESDQRAS